ncbi:hypothetical protein [Aeromicrobium sp. 9AM]|uniref:hypothetical protein n=1 Tax=Aeromicrobium sp. 9AM TaxID=2653126 RepID=UPI0012F09E02|nr:hypothetical protein [Aeromicrobium sp. 9AM]VXC09545.1 hypothetical protein AERO9AM_50038 [Aeromicrobium sp. 9AM]
MSKITAPEIVALAEDGETPWESWNDGEVIMQRDCPDCDHGMLYAPARFHAACGGTGYLTRTVELAAS